MPCLLAVTLAGCQDPGFVCTDESLPAVEVEVRDAVTGEHLSVTPRGIVRDGAFEDSLRAGSTTLSIPPLIVAMVGADERAGIYIVQLEAEGYQPWDTSGVVVTRDECHVRTASFTADLEPVAPLKLSRQTLPGALQASTQVYLAYARLGGDASA